MKTLDDLKAALDGCEYELQIGTDPVELTRVSVESAPDALSWVRQRTPGIGDCRGVVVIGGIIPVPKVRATFIRTDNPRLVFARVAWQLFPPDTFPADNEIQRRAAFYSRWGKYPGIGSTGFGYVRNEKGELERFPHYGKVIIGENVEIGHFTCIDRGALTDTIIEDGVKLDNLVHIAHGAHIGAHTSIAALSCIEGSVKIGKRCTIGSGVTFQIGSGCGNDVTVGSGSVVTKVIPDGQTWLGNPARQWK